MTALKNTNTKKDLITDVEISFCCVTYIDIEQLIYAATSVQALPTSNITLYFSADIDKLRSSYHPECRVDATVAGDYISEKLLTYLKYACSKDALIPYIIYEPTDNPTDWRIIKPVPTITDQTNAIKILDKEADSAIAINIETALSMVKTLTGKDTTAAINAMQTKAETSKLSVIEFPTTINL